MANGDAELGVIQNPNSAEGRDTVIRIIFGISSPAVFAHFLDIRCPVADIGVITHKIVQNFWRAVQFGNLRVHP